MVKKKVSNKDKYKSKAKRNLSSVFAILLLIVGLVVLVSVVSQKTLFNSSAASKVDTFISIDTNKSIASIPNRFLGLSFETSNLCNLVGAWNTPVLEQLFKNLGPQLIRIGGDSADKAFWDADGNYSCSSSKTVLTKKLIDNFLNFSTRINAKVIWTLNLGNYAPTTYSQEAKYIIEKAKEVGGDKGSFLWAMGIGNEPDLYKGNGIKSPDYSVTKYLSDWKNYKNIIRQNTGLPNYKFMANDNCCNDIWFNSLIAQEKNSLSYVSHHYYPTRSNESGDRAASINNLLSSKLMQRTVNDYISKWESTAGDIPLMINETNSTAGGGFKGLSDTFASALWGIDYMFTLVKSGVKNVNFHTGTSPSIYSPITNYENNKWIARPLYYALLLFHYAAPDGSVVSTEVQSPFNIVSHSIVDTKGILRVVIVNKDQNNNSTVKINPNKNYSSAKYITLMANSVNETKNIMMGENSISENGSWKANTKNLTITNDSVTINLPKASAAVVIFQ